MKKKLVSLLLVAAMGVTMLAGCGGNAGTQNSQNNSQPSGPVAVTIKVWCPSNQIDSGLMAEQQKAFAEANKDKWTITWETAPVGEDKAKDEITKDVAAAADVFFYASDQVTALVEQGAIAKLGGEAEKMVKENTAQSVIDTVTVNGGLYGIPFTHNTFYMYYDKTLLNEEDVKTMEGILAKDLGEGALNFNFESAGGWKFGAWYYGAGLTVFGTEGSSLETGCDWNNATGLAVTNYLIDLAKNPKVGMEVPSAEKAAEHKLGAWFGGSWEYDTFAQAVGAENLGMTTIPTFKVDGKDVQLKGFYGSKSIGVNAQSKCLPAAVAFATYLGSEEQQLARYEKSNQIPANKNAAANAKVQADPMAKVLIEESNNCSVAQPSASLFGARYWNYCGGFYTAIKDGTVTKENVQAKLDELVLSLTAE